MPAKAIGATVRRPARPAAQTQPEPAAEAPAVETAPEAEAPAETNDTGDAGQSGASTAMSKLAASRALNIPGIRAQFTPTALILPDKMSIGDWTKVVDAIDGVREGARWWFGDAINAGEARFGERYSQALDASKYDYATLRNLALVARRFQPDTIVDGEIVPGRRHATLSWSHHHAVIGVPADVADEILRTAEAESWSVAQVRAHVKEIKATGKGADTGGTPPTNGNGIVPGMARPTANPQDLPGVKPLTEAQAAEYANSGQTTYICEGCPSIFGEQVWHCLGCGGHWSLDVDDCLNPACGEDIAPDETETVPTPISTGANGTTPRVVSGEILPSAASQMGADQALLVLASFPFRDLDPSDIAASLLASDGIPDALSALMGVHDWLAEVIEAMAGADDEDEDGRDGPSDPEDADETGDTLGDLDFDDASDAEDASGEAESDEMAEDTGDTVDASAVADTGRPGAWSTKGANVVPDATPAAPAKPLSPAPKPAGRPVRRRTAKAE